MVVEGWELIRSQAYLLEAGVELEEGQSLLCAAQEAIIIARSINAPVVAPAIGPVAAPFAAALHVPSVQQKWPWAQSFLLEVFSH